MPEPTSTPDPGGTARQRRRRAIDALLDNVYFVLAGIAAVFLAYLLLQEGFEWGWGQLWFYLLFWVVLAYLVLPRLHHILTDVYVPNYFIGRARTSDGLLGDPVNIGLLGSGPQVHHTMLAAGWTRADDLSFGSGWRIVTSTVLGRTYHQAPVSPLLLFGRQQDFAYQQEVDGNPSKRHHVRFWRCPPGWLLPGGIPVDWLAAGTYDRAVGFSLFTLQITHKIDEDTDIERDHVVGTMMQADPAIGLSVIKDFSAGYHARNGGGDSIATDGDLPIVDLGAVAAPTADPSGEPELDSRARRQAPTVVGALLVLARAIVGIATIAAIALSWDEYLGGMVVRGLDRQVVLWLIVSFVALLVLADVLLAVFVYLGSTTARTLAMMFSTLSIVVQLIDFLTGGPEITLATNLLGVSLDILVLLALSSGRARDFAASRRYGDRVGGPRVDGRVRARP